MSTVYVDRINAGSPRRSEAKTGKFSNDRRKSRNAYPTTGTAPLSNEQKAKLCIKAKLAFDHVHADGHIASAAEVEAWRREEQFNAVGHQSLTTCTQGHYLPLLSHFARLAGEDGEAYVIENRVATTPERIALHKLTLECRSRGLELSYPLTIAKSRFKVTTLEDCTAKQLWQLLFTVRKSKHKPKAAKASKTVDEPF